jgi:hypothetical protein
LGLLVVGIVLGMPARAHGAKVILPRPGEIGFAGLAQYGSLLKGGEIGEDWSAGPGFALRLRYRMRYERAFGLSFERHGFSPRNKSTADTAASKLTLLATGVDIYQMFGTRTRAVKMLSAGVGLAQASQKLNDGQSLLSGKGVGDGFYVSLGGEIEYYFWRSWAMDFSLRYFAVILHESTNHDFQLGAGLVFYATD